MVPLMLMLTLMLLLIAWVCQGGTNGIGAGIALRLAAANVSVIVVGRSAQRGQQMVDAMTALAPGGTFEFIACTLCRFTKDAGPRSVVSEL